MSYIEIEHNKYIGWFCHNDLILICDRETFTHDVNNPFVNDDKLESMCSYKLKRKTRRHIPKLDFTDEKLFPSMLNKIIRTPAKKIFDEKHNDEDLISELNSMLDCREYVNKQNNFFDRKQFQLTQTSQVDQEKQLKDFQRSQQDQSKIEKQRRRRQHPLYVSRFDEKRYEPSMQKKLYQFYN